MAERRAECNCGQLAVLCTAEPLRVSVCHCLACKRRTGSAFSTNARFVATDVRVTGRTAEFKRIGGETGRVTTNSFCPDCGATVFYKSETDPDLVVIPVGTFADLSFPAPTRSFFHRTRRYPWVEITADPLDCID